MHARTISFLIASVALLCPVFASADMFLPPPLPPPVPTVNLTDTCTPSAVDGATHTYSGQFLGICALLAAKDQGAITDYTLSSYDAALGFFLGSINGTSPGAFQFWNIMLNGTDASVGLSSMAVVTGDILSFQLKQCDSAWSNCVGTGSTISFKIGTLTATPVVPSPSGGSIGGGGVFMHPPFDVSLAFQYLANTQNTDGSFGSPMLTDWVAIASAADKPADLRAKLSTYESANPLVSTSITENERHAMALESLGIDPAAGTGVDYIAPIVRAFDGTQIGDPNLVNDDIFAIFPLLHAGYSTSDPIIAATEAFIIAKQGADGSWASSVDLTAAAIQALALMPDTGDTRYAISKAVGYLRGKQKTDGSFGDPFSTSWMIQAIAAMNGTTADWQQRIYTPDYFLATKQDADGSVMASSTSDRMWATAYAIPAIRRATWDSLLASFPKYVPPVAAPVEATSSDAVTQDTQSGPILKVASVDAAADVPHSSQPAASEDTPTPETPPPADAASSQSAAAASAAGGLNENWLFLLIGFLILLGYCGLAYRSIRKRS